MLFQDARDVVDIGSAIREILVRQASEARREVGSRFGDRPLGIDFLMHDSALARAADSAARRNRSISGSISSGSRVLFGEESSRETQSTARPTATPGDTGIPVSES